MDPELVVLDAEENRREDHDALIELGVPVHVLRIRSIEDVNVQLAELASSLEARWTPVRIPHAPTRASAFIPIWRRPWMALGAPTYASSLLQSLGVANICADDGPYPVLDLERAKERRPDVVLAPSEPYPFSERQRGELETVAPTLFVDGRDLFWWGSRTPRALERISAALS
jgi:ABC-type Fe3+-hydroxamate transport system substrate-binding protein